MSKIYPKPTEEIAEMVCDNIPFCKDWGRDAVLPWIQWFINSERYLAVSSNGKLSGVTLFRMVDSEEDCHEHYRDTGGDVCYIEIAVSKHPSGLRSMYDMLWNGIGKSARKMAWIRHKYNGRITIVDMEKAKRRFMR